MNSITGVVAIVMIFGLPVVAILAVMVIVLALAQRRHRERMKMIEQGILPPPPRQTAKTYFGLLIWGVILLAFGLALFVGELAKKSNDITGGLIFGLIGLGLIVCFAFIRGMRKKEMPAVDADKRSETPPQG
jgi:phosphatidylglycerophosphate synthase